MIPLPPLPPFLNLVSPLNFCLNLRRSIASTPIREGRESQNENVEPHMFWMSEGGGVRAQYPQPVGGHVTIRGWKGASKSQEGTEDKRVTAAGTGHRSTGGCCCQGSPVAAAPLLSGEANEAICFSLPAPPTLPALCGPTTALGYLSNDTSAIQGFRGSPKLLRT